MPSRKSWLRNLILVVILASLVPPVLFGTPRIVSGQDGGDWWRNVIFDFQTLIGGLLAIFAAWWTVVTMERTDEAARVRHQEQIDQSQLAEAGNARRHQQALALTLRPDVLKVARLSIPQADDLAEIRKDLEVLAEKIDEDSEGTLLVSDTLRKTCDELEGLLERKCWSDASPLLDGHITKSIVELRLANLELRYKLDYFKLERAGSTRVYAPEDSGTFFSPHGRKLLDAIKIDAQGVVGHAAALQRHMRRLEAEYSRIGESIRTVLDTI